MSSSELFASDGFLDGRWAHGLSWLLAPKRFIKDWHPKIRQEDQHASRRWIQYEPVLWSGSLQWRGKPAIRAVNSDSARMLLVGYHVEKGLATRADDSQPLMSGIWHWHGFAKCLADPELREVLHAYVLELPASRRTVWIRSENAESVWSYEGRETLDALDDRVAAAARNAPMEVILGAAFTQSECQSFEKPDLSAEFGGHIIWSHRLAHLIESVQPPSNTNSI